MMSAVDGTDISESAGYAQPRHVYYIPKADSNFGLAERLKASGKQSLIRATSNGSFIPKADID